MHDCVHTTEIQMQKNTVKKTLLVNFVLGQIMNLTTVYNTYIFTYKFLT